MGQMGTCMAEGEKPFELAMRICYFESFDNSDELQIELSCGKSVDISEIACSKVKSSRVPGMCIYKFPRIKKGLLIVQGRNVDTDSIGIRQLPSGRGVPAISVSSLGLKDGIKTELELQIRGGILAVDVTLVMAKLGFGLQPPRQPPRLGAPVPSNLYRDIPAELWEGVYMDGPFVGRSEVGKIPLIFSVPHNGKVKSADPPRAAGRGEPDLHTMEIALAAFQEVKKALGAPTIVTQLLNRHWVDVNRGKPYHVMIEAYDGHDGEDAYWTFHYNLSEVVEEYKQRSQIPLVIDIHGSANPKLKGKVDPTYGGEKATFMPAMKQTYGDIQQCMWTGPNALLKALKENGVTPNEGKNFFNGGFTVTYYSAHFGANAIQMEFDAHYRATYEDASAAGAALGKALVEFLPHHECPV